MKIAFLLYHWPVLSETFILNQITGLLDRGHEVDVYAKSPGTEPVTHADVERYNLAQRTFYFRDQVQWVPHNKFMRLIKAISAFATHVHKKPRPVLNSLNVFKFGKGALSLTVFYQIVPFLKYDMEKYDIVHCHFGPNGNLAALLKDAGVIKAKIVTTFHGEAGYTKERWHALGYEPLFRLGDAISPMSEKEKGDLVKLGCSPQKIVIHRMGVDTDKFAFAPRQPGNARTCLLTVGRLAEKKGIEYGIRAVARALQKHPHIAYTIIGDGPLKDELQDLVNALNVNAQVKLLGWKRQEEVIELTKQAHIFLAPSVTSSDGDQEGVPVVLMEAMAQGLPIISTWHAGIPELVRDGESGFLVPERDVDALTEKLEYLVEHPEIWPDMGRAGRDYVERYFDINKLNDQLVELYQRLLNEEPHQWQD